jgi:CheY-like chemotaxis protein
MSSTVLLIEDNQSDVYVIRQVLKACGVPINLIVAADGEEALSILEALPGAIPVPQPSLILLDWNLPRISGAEILTYVRKSERWRNTPVVIVTSTSSPDEMISINTLGATGYFRKPTDLDAYLALGKIILDALPQRTEG